MSEHEEIKQLVSVYGKRAYEKGAGYGDENTDVILRKINTLIDAQQGRLEITEAEDARRAKELVALREQLDQQAAALEAAQRENEQLRAFVAMTQQWVKDYQMGKSYVTDFAKMVKRALQGGEGE